MIDVRMVILSIATLGGCGDADESGVLGSRSDRVVQHFATTCLTKVVETDSTITCDASRNMDDPFEYSISFDERGRIKHINLDRVSRQAQVTETFDRVFSEIVSDRVSETLRRSISTFRFAPESNSHWVWKGHTQGVLMITTKPDEDGRRAVMWYSAPLE